MRSFSVYSNDSNRFFFSIHLTEIFSYDTVIMGEYKRMYEIESKHISKDIWISINKRSLPWITGRNKEYLIRKIICGIIDKLKYLFFFSI